MPTLTASDIILLLVTIGGGWKWWQDRRDARSTLSTAKVEADKAVTTLKETIVTKDQEITAIRTDRDYWQERAMHAEDIAFGARR